MFSSCQEVEHFLFLVCEKKVIFFECYYRKHKDLKFLPNTKGTKVMKILHEAWGLTYIFPVQLRLLYDYEVRFSYVLPLNLGPFAKMAESIGEMAESIKLHLHPFH